MSEDDSETDGLPMDWAHPALSRHHAHWQVLGFLYLQEAVFCDVGNIADFF
jgi:hypothetical protein